MNPCNANHSNTNKDGGEEDRWMGALRIPLDIATTTTTEDPSILEVVGLDSQTHTVFARLSGEESIVKVIDTILQRMCPRDDLMKSKDLLDLGAVWLRTPPDRPQNKPVWRRQRTPQSVDSSMVLRIHTRPSRYPIARSFQESLCCGEPKSAIVYEHCERDKDQSFLVLNKPHGLPTHATVDNGVENLLYQVQEFFGLEYASVPQRLDTETSGLILVSTTPQSASYFGKIFEDKTNGSNGLQKQYRCLVSFPSLEAWESIRKHYCSGNRPVVEHYQDANSKAPKVFVSKTIAMPKDPSSNWKVCRLRIQSMTECWKVRDTLVSELEIDLLTGRTHQIRGQLAALGCPIVGDRLYGGCASICHGLALQCCRLSFPSLDLRLPKGWWSDFDF